jgi:hypothetical protein
MSVDDENCHWSMNSERGTTTRDEREVESPRPIAAIRFGKVIACTITGLTHQDVSLPPHPSVQPAGAGFRAPGALVPEAWKDLRMREKMV